MQPISQKVKNVTLYRYFDPLKPLQQIILTGASGTYSVGTFLTSTFYDLKLENAGEKKAPLLVHDPYFATFEIENGGQLTTTPWMYCLNNSDQPTFGRSITLGAGDLKSGLPLFSENIPELIQLGPLSNITVSQLFPAPAIGQRTLIKNGTGHIVATKYGTPHEMGVEVEAGDWVSEFFPGTTNIIITGTTKQGSSYSNKGYTALSNDKPAVFLQEFWK